MTLVTLPDWPGATDTTPLFTDWSQTLVPFLGGDIQRLRRLGARFALGVRMPTMAPEPWGRLWVARLNRALIEGQTAFAWPQREFDTGVPGTVVADGAGQQGSSLKLRGLTPRYRLREGQYFSVASGGRRRLHQAVAEVVADASGKATVAILPMLRASTADGDAVEIARPKIEGLLEGDSRSWTPGVALLTGLEFTIKEIG